MNETLKLIEQERIIGIIRTKTTEQALHVVDAMAAGGMKLIEITCTVPDYVSVIERIKQHKDTVAGAGTVTDMDRARAVVEAGVKFVVAPNIDEDVIAYAKEAGCVVMPGAATPTEIVRAWRLGADAVKVFPINALGGASFLELIKGPLPDIRVMPTGEVELEQIHDYLQAGAFCVGVGTAIVESHALDDEAWDRIADYTRAAIVRARSV